MGSVSVALYDTREKVFLLYTGKTVRLPVPATESSTICHRADNATVSDSRSSSVCDDDDSAGGEDWRNSSSTQPCDHGCASILQCFAMPIGVGVASLSGM